MIGHNWSLIGKLIQASALSPEIQGFSSFFAIVSAISIDEKSFSIPMLSISNLETSIACH